MEDHEMCNEDRALLEKPYSRVSFFASSTIILYGLLLASVMLIFHVVFQRKNEDLSQYHVTRCISTLICNVVVILLMQITGPRKECNHRQVVMVLVEVESTKLIADVLIYSSGVLIHQKNKNLGKKFKTFYIKAIFIFCYCILIQTILIVHQKKILYKSITDLLLYLITLLVTSIAAYRTSQRKSHNSQLPIFGFHFYSRKKENFLFLNHGVLGPNCKFC